MTIDIYLVSSLNGFLKEFIVFIFTLFQVVVNFPISFVTSQDYGFLCGQLDKPVDITQSSKLAFHPT